MSNAEEKYGPDMEFKTVFEDNIENYSALVDEDVAENMERLYYRGLAGHDPDDDSILSLLIWELKSAEDITDTESELKWIYAVDPSFLPPLLEGYHKEAMSEEVRKTSFESSTLEKGEKEALSDGGFSLQEVEGRDIRLTVGECRKLPIAGKEAPSYVESIEHLDNQDFYQGLMNILFRYDNPALKDLAYLPKNGTNRLSPAT